MGIVSHRNFINVSEDSLMIIGGGAYLLLQIKQSNKWFWY